MSVVICGEDRTKLRVMGDIEAELSVPPSSAGRCWISVSDGTLIEAAYGEGDSCRFAVSEEGAGIARIQREGANDVLRLDWRVEWVTVAPASNAARAVMPGEAMPVLPGLFGQEHPSCEPGASPASALLHDKSGRAPKGAAAN